MSDTGVLSLLCAKNTTAPVHKPTKCSPKCYLPRGKSPGLPNLLKHLFSSHLRASWQIIFLLAVFLMLAHKLQKTLGYTLAFCQFLFAAKPKKKKNVGLVRFCWISKNLDGFGWEIPLIWDGLYTS